MNINEELQIGVILPSDNTPGDYPVGVGIKPDGYMYLRILDEHNDPGICLSEQDRIALRDILNKLHPLDLMVQS